LPATKKAYSGLDVGEPEDVGNVVVSFVKGDFMYSTEQVIMVDGGLTISPVIVSMVVNCSVKKIRSGSYRIIKPG